MADIFYRCDAVKLLHKKHIMFLGDSNSRAIYKDVIWLLNRNSLIKQADLRRKQEPSFCGDKLGKHSALNRGRYYEEERFYKRNGTQVDFYFLTKCYNDTLVDMMEDIHLRTKKAPDVICINSTLWDVCRWGPNSITQFKDNLQKLAKLLKCSLPPTTLVIWLTSLPVSFKIQSSFIIKQIDFLRYTLRFDVMEANNFARQVMVAHGFDVLDNHFHMRMQIHRRIHDGVHYEPTAIRFLTNLLLTHIALSWGRPLPNRIDTLLLDKAKALSSANKGSPTVDIKSTPNKIKKQPIENSSTRKDHNLFPKQRYRNKRNNRERRLAQHELIEKHQHPVIKSVNNRNKSWNTGNQRCWPNSSDSIRNETQWRESSYTPQLWDNDYRSSERHFEEHHQYDPGFSSNPRFYRNFHQSNNFASSFSGRGRQSRYAPY